MSNHNAFSFCLNFMNLILYYILWISLQFWMKLKMGQIQSLLVELWALICYSIHHRFPWAYVCDQLTLHSSVKSSQCLQNHKSQENWSDLTNLVRVTCLWLFTKWPYMTLRPSFSLNFFFFFETCYRWQKVSFGIKIVSFWGCQSLPQGYVCVQNLKNFCVKSVIKAIHLEINNKWL